MKNICFFGEALIDLYTTHIPSAPAEEVSLTANLGGGIFNASVAAARWIKQHAGKDRIHFLGGLSKDFFGQRFAALFEKEGISCQHCFQSAAPTSFALVSLDHTGERSFQFFRKQSADILIPPSHLQADWFRHFSLVALGTNCMTDSHCAATSTQAIQLAHAEKIPIALDPNIRPSLWDEPHQLTGRIRRALQAASIIKIAEEELEIVYPGYSFDKAIEHIQRERGPQVMWRLLFVTQGSAGATVYLPDGSHHNVPVRSVKVVDTTGAGDAFFGAVCVSLMQRLPALFTQEVDQPLEIIMSNEGKEQVIAAATDAVQFASMTVGHRGGIGYHPDS